MKPPDMRTFGNVLEIKYVKVINNTYYIKKVLFFLQDFTVAVN